MAFLSKEDLDSLIKAVNQIAEDDRREREEKEARTTCPSCGRLYADHPGLIPTCLELQRMKEDMDDWMKKFEALEVRASNARISALEEAARIAEAFCPSNKAASAAHQIAAAIRKAAKP